MQLKGTVKKPGGKKKAKSKSGAYKISLAKINNKKTNKLAKQGKLKPKVKKKDRLREKEQSAATEKEKERQAQRLKERSESEAVSGSEGSSEEEEEVDAEDTSYFEHLDNAWQFANTNLSFGTNAEGPTTKKRKTVKGDEEEEDKEADYELQGVRKFASEEQEGDMKMMLPIISKGKVIRQMAHRDNAQEEEQEQFNLLPELPKPPVAAPEVEEEKPLSLREKEMAYIQTLNSAQLFAYRQTKLQEKKARISALAHSVLENPQQNIGKLKDLRLMLGENDLGVSLTVRKYAMVSLMEVFKDIVPGYRMRIPTEKETTSTNKLKQETKFLLDYEASFLLNYRIYLEFLENTAKMKPIQDKSFLTKHGIKNLKVPAASAIELGALAVKCLSEMLTNNFHFNYRSNLIVTLVHFTNHGRPEYSSEACDGLKRIFRTDKKGDVILEVVRAIGKMIKRRNYDVRPQVLMTYLALKIKEVDLSSIRKKTEKMTRQQKMKNLSRKQRKDLKLKEKLDHELLETKATEDKSQILKLHTEIIQSVFETYIRVIKLASDSDLLGPVLEGLAQFAHLINIEYFDSLFSAFNKLVESGTLTVRETLHCLQTAFTILSGQGSVLNIDPTNFYKHLYGALLSVHLGSSEDTTPIVLKSLDIMISKRRKQVSQQRILAFVKRLSSLCLQQTPETVMSILAVIRCFLHTYKHTDILLDVEASGSGVYLPLLEDPEHCCANSTSLYEMHLLRQHYEPDVRRFAEHLLKGAPLTGQNQLPNQLSRPTPKELFKTYSNHSFFPDSLPEKLPKKRKIHHDQGFADADFEAYTSKVMDSVKSFEHDGGRRSSQAKEAMDLT